VNARLCRRVEQEIPERMLHHLKLKLSSWQLALPKQRQSRRNPPPSARPLQMLWRVSGGLL